MLLKLPPEIVQAILWHMDPGTLMVCLSLSAKLFRLAESKHLLLHQLRSVPGLTLGLEDLSTHDAFLLFRQRAIRNLCGSQVLARLTRYSAGPDKISVRQCVFSPGTPLRLAVAYHHQSVIRIYDFQGVNMLLNTDLQAHLFQDEGDDCQLKLLNIAFSSNRDVAGLYRYTPSLGSGGPLVKDAIERSKKTLKLVVFTDFGSPPKGRRGRTYSTYQGTRDIVVDDGTEPTALAIGKDGTACIAWARSDRPVVVKIGLYLKDQVLLETCGYGQCALLFLQTPIRFNSPLSDQGIRILLLLVFNLFPVR